MVANGTEQHPSLALQAGELTSGHEQETDKQMKRQQQLKLAIAIAMFAFPSLRAAEPEAKAAEPAEESSPEISGLEKTAADFIVAYNNKDAAALAALFTEQGEVADLEAKDVTTGHKEIQARYEEIFAEENVPALAIEVDSVRLVGTNLAMEDGTLHFTGEGEDAPAKSATYSAVLQKNAQGAWQIASTRQLQDVTSPAGHLADLAASLKGDWTGQKDGTRLDLAFGWDESGQAVTGLLLVSKADAKPLKTTIRFAWDAARKTISCWTFDDAGGFAKADWTPIEGGWQIRTEGTTADGETMSANQTLVFEGKDAYNWTGKDRLIDGASQPDTNVRIVRQSPEPAAE